MASLLARFTPERALRVLVQSLNSPFFPPPIGAELGRAKEDSRITCMRMLRTNQSKITSSQPRCLRHILVPRGRAPFGQHQESRPLAKSNDIPVLNGFVNRLRPEPIRFIRLGSEHAHSDGKSVNRGLPVLDQARSRPEVAILSADQKERGLVLYRKHDFHCTLGALENYV